MEENRVWLNPAVRRDFIAYYQEVLFNSDICYATGKIIPISQQSSAKIRHVGDKAKLVSSNDLSGFTYRGRFTKASQAVVQSYEVSQKSVNALKWLIANQGSKSGDQVIVAWATSNESLPKFLESPASIFGDDLYDDVLTEDTREEFAARLNKAIAGYSANLNDNASIVVMGLDSATPGRLSITYYRELRKSDFLNRIKRWYETVNWYPLYRLQKADDGKSHVISFRGAPVPKDIAVAAYGSEINDKLKKATIERLLPCIIGTVLLSPGISYFQLQCGLLAHFQWRHGCIVTR